MKIYSKRNSRISIRYCMGCEKISRFKYNAFIGHSECTKCLCRDSRQITEEEFKGTELQSGCWDID